MILFVIIGITIIAILIVTDFKSENLERTGVQHETEDIVRFKIKNPRFFYSCGRVSGIDFEGTDPSWAYESYTHMDGRVKSVRKIPRAYMGNHEGVQFLYRRN